MSRGDNFVIKKNFFYDTHSKTILRNGLRECTRGNDSDDEFICKNVIIFGLFRLDLAYDKMAVGTISCVLVLSHHIALFTHTNNKTLFFLFPHSLCLCLCLSLSLNQSHSIFLQNHTPIFSPKLFVFHFLSESHSHNCLYRCYGEAVIETVASRYPRQSLANTASRVSFFLSFSFAF